MAASIKKVSAASARAHTRKQKQGSSPSLPPGENPLEIDEKWFIYLSYYVRLVS